MIFNLFNSNKMQIDKEYEQCDYSEALINHVNHRLRSLKIKEIMEYWNKCRIEKMSKDDILYATLIKFGINKNTLELIEILYTQDVFTIFQLFTY